MSNRTTWTVHPIANTEGDGDGPLYALLPDDGTQGLVIGDYHDVHAAYQCLAAMVAGDHHGGEIAEFDQRLGHRQLSTSEAAEEYGVAVPSITLACRRGQIAGAVKVRNSWRFSENSFRAWLKHRPGRGRWQRKGKE